MGVYLITPINLCFRIGLMGEANLRFARGEKEDAIKLCMEVVRQVNSKRLASGK
jgi:hypothetical protein